LNDAFPCSVTAVGSRHNQPALSFQGHGAILEKIFGETLAGAIVIFTAGSTTSAQQEPLCVENSPERKGEIGCSIIEIKPLPENLHEPVFWHIDRFDKEEDARVAVRPTSVAFQAHGFGWLMTIESQPSGKESNAWKQRNAHLK
jgi:hypothetical protein